MSDAARVAAEALEMGFRSMAHLLNSIMELQGVKARIPCEAIRPGDDIDEAADQLKAELQQLDPRKFREREVSKVAPWAFGRIHRADLCCFELGNSLQSYGFWIGRLNSEEWAKWPSKDWEEFIVDPVVRYHEEMRAWLADLLKAHQELNDAEQFVIGRKQDIAKALGFSVRTLMRHVDGGIYEASEINSKILRIRKRHLPPDFS